MFNKRDHQDESQRTAAGDASPEPARSARAGARGGQAAVLGPSIEVDGKLKGDEDLVVEGRIKGTVMLKQHTLTVGSQGRLDAEVYAHSILVDGTVHGDLYASERVSIRKTARIEGNILAPRISLEDGAKFRGSIDMDAESEAFRKAFGQQPSRAGGTPSQQSSPPSGSSSSAAKPATGSGNETSKQKAEGSAA